MVFNVSLNTGNFIAYEQFLKFSYKDFYITTIEMKFAGGYWYVNILYEGKL